MSIANRLSMAWRALGGAGESPTPSASGAGAQAPAPASARLAELELELAARDERIAALLAEAEAQRGEAKADADALAADRMSRILRRLTPLVAQADAMQAFEASGKPVRAEDAFALVGKIEKVLKDEGVQRIGAVGQEVTFDHHLHQRLSGGDVRDGDPVHVRFIGFRHGERILHKAQVSRRETPEARQRREAEEGGGDDGDRD